MAMPNNLIFVRHGESEANVVQRAEKHGLGHLVPEGFYDRPDWQHRLSAQGREQAQAAGRWILDNIGEPQEYFDVRYLSPFMRTRETAQLIGGTACTWVKQDRIIERSWGAYGSVSLEERQRMYANTDRLKRLNPWYVGLDGGESLAGGVLTRYRDWQGTLHREEAGRNVLAVTHGEFMWAARYVTEELLPEEWEAMDDDKSLRISNCCILWYSRVNPDDQEDVREKISWRRMVNPVDPSKSPYDGGWQPLPGKREFSGHDLNESLQLAPLMLDESLQVRIEDAIAAAKAVADPEPAQR